MTSFDPGFDIRATHDPLGFACGPGTFGPVPEMRPLDAIRRSLRQPDELPEGQRRIGNGVFCVDQRRSLRCALNEMAETTRLEPATSCVTGGVLTLQFPDGAGSRAAVWLESGRRHVFSVTQENTVEGHAMI